MRTATHLRFLLWSILTIISLSTLAQTRVDRLEVDLKRSSGTKKVDLLNQIAYEYIANDKEKANEFSLTALKLATELNYTEGQGAALIYKGVNEYLSGEFAAAMPDLRNGIRLIKGIDKQLEGYGYLQMGNAFMNQTQLDSSLYYFERSYEIQKDSANPANLSKLYKNMGALYGLRSDPAKHISYFKKSLRIRELLDDRQLLADVLIELGRLHAQSLDCDVANNYLDRAEAILAAFPSDFDNRSDLSQARAICMINAGQSAKAFALLDSALTYYQRAGLSMKTMTSHMDMGSIFLDRGEYEVALKNYYAALRIAETKSYPLQKQDIQVSLGWVYYHLGELEQALELSSKALEEAQSRNFLFRLANALNLKGVTLTELRRYDEAEAVLRECLAIREKIGDPVKVSEGYVNLGYLKEQMGEYPAARAYYVRSIDEATPRSFQLGIAWGTLGLGTIALKEHRLDDAAKWLTKAEAVGKSVSANQVLIRAYTAKRDLLRAQGAWQASLHYAIRVDALKDSINRGDITRRFANLQKMNEIEKRDEDIRALEQERLLAREKIQLQEAALRQNYIILIAAIVAALLVSAIALVYARYYFKVRKLNRTIKSANDSITLHSQRLSEANHQLEQLTRSLTEKNDEIQTQSVELAKNHQHITLLNENLQVLVAQKTNDLIRANEELLKQNNELQQFSYSLSHNLRGPVARIMGLAHLIQDPRRGDEVETLSKLMLRTSNDLDQVLRDLSKIIDAKNELHHVKEWVDLNQEWIKCIEFLRDSLPEDSVIDTRLDVPPVFTMRAFIHSVFINLLSNSIKYRSLERPLQVSLVVEASSKDVYLHFSDNGLGVDLDQYGDSIFKLFKRFHTHVEGRGIGLYLIKTQVESLNGSIRIDSSVGKGTRFEIFIPQVFEGASDIKHPVSGERSYEMSHRAKG